MSVIGKKVHIYDEETGAGDDYVINDTPLARWMGGLFDAARTFGLSDEEVLAIWEFTCRHTRRPGAGIPLRGLLPVVRVGVDGLVKRGWMTRNSRVAHLVQNESTEAIYAAANAALRFGPSAESDRVQ